MSIAQIVENWTNEQILHWFKGIDASIRPFLSNIAQSKIDGRSLFVIDDEFLQQIGISIFGVRHILLQAVGLLRHLCYGMKSENLQSLCLRIVISSRELSNTLKLADKCKIALNKLNVIAVLSTVLMSISRVIEDIKRLLGWLDRSPFDRLEKYIEFRSDIVGITLELSRSVCIPRKQLLFNFRQIKELCDRLIIKCESIICLSNDPSILYTAYLERVVLRKLNPSDDWSSYHGIHIVSEVKIHSPADICGKIDAGDEILQINDETVVGWNIGQVAKLLCSGGNAIFNQLVLIIKKRPSEMTQSSLFARSRNAELQQILHQKTPNSLLKFSSNSHRAAISLLFDNCDLLISDKLCVEDARIRRRALSLHSQASIFGPLQSEFSILNPSVVAATSRRATISCGTPPAILFNGRNISVDDLLQVDAKDMLSNISETYKKLDDCCGKSANININAPELTIISREGRLMRHQHLGYVRSFIDNQLIVENLIDHISNVQSIDEQLVDSIFSINCLDDFVISLEPDEYATIGIVEAHELNEMDLPSSNLIDWDSCLDLRITIGCKNCVDSLSPVFLEKEVSGDYNNKHHDDGEIITVSKHNLTESINLNTCKKSDCSQSVGAINAPIAEFDESGSDCMSDSESENHFPSINNTENITASNEPNLLREMARIPYYSLNAKTCEGWIHRKRFAHETSYRGKWIKCWMVLCSSVLFIYSNKSAPNADIIIAVANFFVSDAPFLKTSKKHVFRLYRRSVVFLFSAFTTYDMKNWMNKLGLATICYNQTEEERNNSTNLSRSMLYISTFSESTYSLLFAETPPVTPAHYILPRPSNLKLSTRRHFRDPRQASISSLRSIVSNKGTH